LRPTRSMCPSPSGDHRLLLPFSRERSGRAVESWTLRRQSGVGEAPVTGPPPRCGIPAARHEAAARDAAAQGRADEASWHRDWQWRPSSSLLRTCGSTRRLEDDVAAELIGDRRRWRSRRNSGAPPGPTRPVCLGRDESAHRSGATRVTARRAGNRLRAASGASAPRSDGRLVGRNAATVDCARDGVEPRLRAAAWSVMPAGKDARIERRSTRARSSRA
jgi:hypothetical protein